MSVFLTKNLSAVCDISMGQAPKGDSYNTTRSGYPLIAGAGDFGELTPAPKKYTDAPTKLSRPGDLILCIRATIGDRNWSDKEYCLGRGVAGLRAKDADLSQAYLGHWLDHVAPVLRAQGRGATFLQVSKSDIASLQIPLPPFAEQKRIAGILDAADALRAKRREALAHLDTLLQSTFLDMFGDPVTNPMGWEERSLGELAQDSFRNGLSPSTQGTVDGEVLTLSAITRGRFNFAAKKSARFDKAPSPSQRLSTDTFLICRGNGNRRLVGTGAYPDRSSNRVCFPDTMIGVEISPSVLAAAYLQNVWRTRRVRRQIERGARTTSGTHKVNQRLLSSVVFPVPPADLQLHFAAIVESVEQQRAIQRAHLAELDTLFASLQSRAFRGDL